MYFNYKLTICGPMGSRGTARRLRVSHPCLHVALNVLTLIVLCRSTPYHEHVLSWTAERLVCVASEAESVRLLHFCYIACLFCNGRSLNLRQNLTDHMLFPCSNVLRLVCECFIASNNLVSAVLFLMEHLAVKTTVIC